MRKVPLLVAALVVPVLPVLAAAPAYAVDHVICVGGPVGPCDATEASIPDAITAAGGNGLADTILLGPGTYTDGPYTLTGTTEDLTLKGSGSATVLTLPAGGIQSYVTANHATVRDLTIEMNPTDSISDKAVRAFAGSIVESVTVDGTTTTNATGVHATASQVSGSSILMPFTSGSRGMFVDGASAVTDSVVTGTTGINHSGTGTPDTVSRTTIRAGATAGVITDSGTVEIDNSVIDLGSLGGSGLRAANFNNSTTLKTINADHVTIVGGNGSSEGVWAYAATATALQATEVTVTNSIIRGPGTSLVADAGNAGGQGGDSTATIDVSYTDYQTTGGTIGANGAGGVQLGAGNLVDVDPLFVDAAAGDFHLGMGSPVIDAGDPVAGDPSTKDLDNAAREVDGDVDGSVRRDLGAYEFVPDLIAPTATITGGPTGPTRDTTPTFTFTSEPGASLACQIDAGAFHACTSPFTSAALANGSHTFRVMATDASNNVGVAAARNFQVDTIAPHTVFTKKPAKQITKKRARFAFASEAGARFQCRLDRGAWKACTSPKTVRVKKGKHRFSVRAMDLAGNVDPTPAVYRFRRV